jgi:hypothetical protein
LSKKSNAGGIIIPDFKRNYKVAAIKTAWYWHKMRYKDQWNRIEVPDMNPHRYFHPNFHKGAKNIRCKKRLPLQQMLMGKVVICLQKTETRSMPVTLY